MSRIPKGRLIHRKTISSPGVDLFPFLSILLCMMGVLAFIQILMSRTAPRKIELIGDVAEGHKTAYQIFCFSEGMVIVPPTERLLELEQNLPENRRSNVSEIRKKRIEELASLGKMGKDYRKAAFIPDEKNVLKFLDEIVLLNNVGFRFQYEEFLLFGIYPGGTGTYHKIRSFLNRLKDKGKYSGIDVGLDPLDPTWTLTASLHPEGKKQ